MTVAAGTAPSGSRGWVARRTRVLAGFLLGFAVGILVIAGGLLAFRETYAGLIVPGVHVGSLDVGGLTVAEARARLANELAGYGEGRVVLRSGLGSITFSYLEVGRGADLDAILAAAAGTARGGSPLEEALDGLRLRMHPVTLEPGVRFDRARLTAQLDAFTARTALRPLDATVLGGPTFGIVRGVNGARLDLSGVAARLAAALADPATGPRIDLAVGTIVIPPRLGDEEAMAAKAEALRVATDLALTHGDSRWTIPGSRIATWLRMAWAEGRYGVVVDAAGIPAALDKVAKAVDKAPKEATYLVSRAGRIVGVRASKDGQALDVATTTARVLDALRERARGAAPTPDVRVATLAVAPKLTTDEATKIAPRMVRQGRWTTYYPVGAHNGYGANITIPARRLNGTVVYPGQVFDFWKGLGEVSLRTGYRLGGAIVNGHSVEGKAIAGGICSASTTLFNAAVRAGYPIVARSPHYYYIKRYPLGLDATVSESQSMRFRNDTDTPIIIKGYASPGVITFEIWGVPTGRKVTWTKPVVTNVVRGYETVKYTSALRKGEREQIEWAADGMDVRVTRTVRDADGTLIRRDTFRSHYHRMIGITLVGTG